MVQLSVALEVPNRDSPTSIRSVLDRLSKTAPTDSRAGLQNLTNHVAAELLQRKSSIMSAATRYKHHRDRTKAERDFNEQSVQERSRFEQETLSTAPAAGRKAAWTRLGPPARPPWQW